MTRRTGLDDLELATLRGIRDAGGTLDRPHQKVSRCIERVGRDSDFGSDYALEALLAMDQPWRIANPLVHTHGNDGSPVYPSAPPDVFECRLSPLGTLALTIEESQDGALPLRFINGTTYKGGSTPAFSVEKVLNTLSLIQRDPEVADEEITTTIGNPVFFQNPIIQGDFPPLFKGHEAEITLYPQYSVMTGNDGLEIQVTRFPPFVDPEMFEILGVHTRDWKWKKWVLDTFETGPRLPIVEVNDISHGFVATGHREVRLVLKEGANPLEVIAAVRENPDFYQKLTLKLEAPLPTLLRQWVDEFGASSQANIEEMRRILRIKPVE